MATKEKGGHEEGESRGEAVCGVERPLHWKG